MSGPFGVFLVSADPFFLIMYLWGNNNLVIAFKVRPTHESISLDPLHTHMHTHKHRPLFVTG